MAFDKSVADLLCGAICLTQEVERDDKDVASYIDAMIDFLITGCADPMADDLYEQFVAWCER